MLSLSKRNPRRDIIMRMWAGSIAWLEHEIEGTHATAGSVENDQALAGSRFPRHPPHRPLPCDETTYTSGSNTQCGVKDLDAQTYPPAATILPTGSLSGDDTKNIEASCPWKSSSYQLLPRQADCARMMQQEPRRIGRELCASYERTDSHG